MATSGAATVADYLTELPEERRTAISAVRTVIRTNLPAGYQEVMQHGMIAYVVPLATCPDTYNGLPLVYAALASQKNYMSVYLTNVYGNPKIETWFLQQWAKSGKPLNMGKSCVRFKQLADLPLDLIGETIARTPLAEFLKIVAAAHQK
ncbi:DUF1801 domain-containing protein [candidate division KSB1 bacterium]|nr:DUF1801 domain-containing protein [candidate division KSB1 bacterium]